MKGKPALNTTPQRLDVLQVLRALAALLVVLFHANGPVFSLAKYWGVKPLGDMLELGVAGVHIFFVLSGFVILYAHQHDLGAPARLKDYVLKRIRRIYPLYWLVTLAVLPAYFLLPAIGHGFETQPEAVAASLALMGMQGHDTVLAVAWTLFHEVLFYGAFGVLVWNRRAGAVLLGAWLALCLPGLAGVGLPGYVFSPLNLLFGFGMGAFMLYRQGMVKAPVMWVAVGLLIFAAAACHALHQGNAWDVGAAMGYGAGSAFTLAGLAELERRRQISVHGWLKLMGDASYAVYLIHLPLLALMAKLVVELGVRDALPVTVWFGLFVGTAYAAGVLVYLWLEKPLLAAFGTCLGLGKR